MRVVIVIPARYGSSRLPGKPLIDLVGKPMVQHVYERAAQVSGIEAVIVATDDQRIADVVRSFDGQVVMTCSSHASGTDRLVEVMHHFDADVYVNLQGDEPLVRPSDIDLLLNGMRADPDILVATLCHPVGLREASDPNCVKVVRDSHGGALYFSRSLIPYPRNSDSSSYFKHIGVYAYRHAVLAGYGSMTMSMLEKSESLEQLRLLNAGIRIAVFDVAPTGPGVDTPECLSRVRSIMSGEEVAEVPSLASVKLVIADVDGVLTDGGVWYDETGERLKCFNVRDGLGLRMLEECGIRVAVVSGRDSAALRRRLEDLGVSKFLLGVKDKKSAFVSLMSALGVESSDTLALGDDSIDLPGFAVCGLTATVADAAEYVKSAVSIVLRSKGGQGAFRELADAILNAQGKSHVYSTSQGFLSVMGGMVQ